MRIPTRLRSLTVSLWMGAVGLLSTPVLVHADLVAAPAQISSDGAEAAPKWLLHNDDVSVDTHTFKGQTSATEPFSHSEPAPLSRTDRPEPPRELTSPRLMATSPAAAKAATASDEPALDTDIRSSIKHVVRPLYDEVLGSGVIGALHGLQAELGLDKDTSLSDTHRDGHPQTTDKTVNPSSAQWETQGGGSGQQEPPRTAAQIERDKVLASDLLKQLVDDIQPWALGVLVLYVLIQLVKGARTYLRARATRQLKRRTRRALHRHHR